MTYSRLLTTLDKRIKANKGEDTVIRKVGAQGSGKSA